MSWLTRWRLCFIPVGTVTTEALAMADGHKLHLILVRQRLHSELMSVCSFSWYEMWLQSLDGWLWVILQRPEQLTSNHLWRETNTSCKSGIIRKHNKGLERPGRKFKTKDLRLFEVLMQYLCNPSNQLVVSWLKLHGLNYKAVQFIFIFYLGK